jgi:hypothetical protein
MPGKPFPESRPACFTLKSVVLIHNKLKQFYMIPNDCVAVVEKSYFVKSKIWVEDSDGNVVFGLGRYRILDAIERLGSLQAA